MITSVICSVIRKRLESVFDNVASSTTNTAAMPTTRTRSTRYKASRSALSSQTTKADMRLYNLRLREQKFDILPLKATLSGTVARLTLRLNLHRNPLAFNDFTAELELEGVDVTLHVQGQEHSAGSVPLHACGGTDQETLAQTAIREFLQTIGAETAAELLTGDYSSWLLSRINVVVKKSAVRVQYCCAALGQDPRVSDSVVAVLRVSLLELRQRSSETVSSSVDCAVVGLVLEVSASASDEPPGAADRLSFPVVLNPLNGSFLVTFTEVLPRKPLSGHCWPLLSIAVSATVDKIELTVTEEQVLLLRHCVRDATAVHARYNSLRTQWELSRLLYARKRRITIAVTGRARLAPRTLLRLALKSLRPLYARRKSTSSLATAQYLDAYKACATAALQGIQYHNYAPKKVIANTLKDLEAALPLDLLLRLRKETHVQLLNAGTSVDALLAAIGGDVWTLSYRRLSLSLSLGDGNGFGFPRHSGVQLTLLRLLQGCSPSHWSFNVVLSLSRFSASLFGTPTVPVKNSRGVRPPRPLLHVACQGLQSVSTFEEAKLQGTYRLGRVDCFARDSSELFSCGSAVTEAADTDGDADAFLDCALQSQVKLALGPNSEDVVFVELAMSPVKLVWDERTYLDVHRIFVEDKDSSALEVIIAHETAHTPACNPDLHSSTTSSSGAGRIWATVSCDVVLESVSLHLPLKQFNLREQRDNSIFATLGQCSVRSGEFMSSREASQQGDPDPSSHGYFLSCVDVQLAMATPSSRKQLLEPWQAKGMLSLSPPSQLGLSLSFSPIILVVSESELFNVLEVVEYLVRRWVSAAEGKTRSGRDPRSESSSTFKFQFAAIVATLTPHAQLPSSVSLESLLDSFGRQLRERGAEARVTACHEVLLKRKLAALGFSHHDAASLLLEYTRLAERHLMSDTKPSSLIASKWSPSMSTLSAASPRKQHILSMRISQLELLGSIAGSSYSAELSSEELEMVDVDLLPLLVVRSVDDQTTGRSLVCSVSQPLDTTLPPSLTLATSFVEVRAVSDMQRTLDALHRALLPVQLKLEFLLQRFSGTSSEASSTPLLGTVSVSMQQLDLLLIHKEAFLAEILLSHCESTFVSSGGGDDDVLDMSAESVEVMDLSVGGALHPLVVWSQPSAEGICLKLRREGGGRTDVIVRGLRLCYLSRFLQELSIYFDHTVMRSVASIESYWADAATAREVPLVRADPMGGAYYDSDNDSFDSEDIDTSVLSLTHTSRLPMASTLRIINEPESNPAASTGEQFHWSLVMEVCTVYVPRNSSSRDAIGITMKSAAYAGSMTTASWPVPCAFEESTRWCHRYFNVSANDWCFGSSPSKASGASQDQSGCFERREITVSGCEMFACITGSYVGLSTVEVKSDELEVFLDAKDGAPVYFTSASKGVGSSSQERWRRISESFNALVVWDVSTQNDKTRILIGDTQDYSALRLNLSLSEHCLLMSLYYDNMFEEQQFFRERKSSKLRNGMSDSARFESEYGSSAYFDFFRHQTASTDIVFARECLAINCSIDSRGSFADDPSSLRFVEKGRNFVEVSAWQRIFPFASIDVNRSVMHYAANLITSQVSFSCGSATISDTTDPDAVHPAVLELANPTGDASNCYGYSNFDLDLCGPQDAAASSPVPISVCSYFNALCNWRTSLVRLYRPDLCTRDLTQIWLLIDYFGLYHSSPGYGNPYCFDYLHSQPDHYGGSDVRVLLKCPALISLKEPTELDTQYLLLEVNGFVTYRLMSDSARSSKITVDVRDAALVLIKQLRTVSRGLRGAAGSGRGIRTLVEHLNFRLAYHVNAVTPTCDVAIDLSNTDAWTESAFDWDEVFVPASQSVDNTCVENVDVIARDFPRSTANLVSSFEDVLMSLSIISGFFSDAADAPRDPGNQFFCVLKVSGFKIVVVDNIVGLHLPLLQIFLEELSITIDGPTLLPVESDVDSKYRFSGAVRLFADYFNYRCRCWEPLIEPIICEAIYEQSGPKRGLSLRSRSNFHVNVSGECIKAISSLQRVIQEDRSPALARKSSGAFDSDALELLGSTYGESVAHHPRQPQMHTRSSISMSMAPVVDNSTSKEILHLPSQRLKDDMRVGFSILNASGQPLRYLVDLGEDRKVIRYLGDGERGTLNFPATQCLIRNNSVVEETFELQRDRTIADRNDKSKRRTVGHMIGFQLSGYQWIETEADVLGARYETMKPVIGRRNPNASFGGQEGSWKRLNALKLVAEVTTSNGGRLLRLHSVFEIRNKTHHKVSVLLSTDSASSTDDSNPLAIEAGRSIYVPLALLQRSMIGSNGASLGQLRVRPADLSVVKNELEIKNNVAVTRLNYSADPVEFVRLVDHSYELLRAAALATDKFPKESLQMVCHIDAENRERAAKSRDRTSKGDVVTTACKLPPFIYNVEVMRVGEGSDQIFRAGAEKSLTNFFKAYLREDAAELRQEPLHYTLVIQPPIIIENLLPTAGRFTIVNTTTKAVLWSKFLTTGESRYIHTLSLEEPLTLLINMGYCRTTEGARIHIPLSHVERGIASIQHAIEGFLEEDVRDKTLWLTDFAGQKLKLHIDNEVGGGGQRFISVYTPYWIVNTSQYTLRYMEELSESVPAGTVTAQKDGTKSVPGGDDDDFRRVHMKTVFPGKPGPLTGAGDIANNDALCELLGELNTEMLTSLAYMFNFSSGNRRMIVQLDDSSWSRPFSLDSVGVHQELSIEAETAGNLEVGFRIDFAPGIYGKYTRILRFSPKFVVVNRLPYNVEICQPTGVVGEFDHSFSVLSNHRKAFHLPSIFGKRKIGLQLEGPWRRSTVFEVDMTGEFTVLAKKEIPLASIDHIVTRPPKFNVLLPAVELGIWFETDWKQQEIVVKAVRSGYYGSNYTEIQVGDVLLSVNGVKASGQNFDKIMMLLKRSNRTLISEGEANGSGQVGQPANAEFMSSEEKLSIIRKDAMIQLGVGEQEAAVVSRKLELEEHRDISEIAVKVSIRVENATVSISLQPVDPEAPPEYLVVNKSPSHSITCKQKGLRGDKWLEIKPGSSATYYWDNPFKQRLLMVQLAKNTLIEQEQSSHNVNEGKDWRGSRQALAKVEKTSVAVELDSIGYQTSIDTLDPVLGKLVLRIIIKGPTKVLEISPDSSNVLQSLKYCDAMINEQLSLLSRFRDSPLLNGLPLHQSSTMAYDSKIAQSIKSMHDAIRSCQKSCFEADDTRVEDAQQMQPYGGYYQSHVSVFGTAVTRRNQILLRIIEAKELKPLLMQGQHTYCKILLKHLDKVLVREYTYRVDETRNPSWINQEFLINLPDEAATSSSRGFVITIIVYSASLVGVDRYLGQVQIPLPVLKSEDRLRGWFALRPQESSIKYSTNTLKVTGSLKLSVQWIYSLDGLLRSLLETSKARLEVLHNLDGTVRSMRQTFENDRLIDRRNLLKYSVFSNEENITGVLKSYATEATTYLRDKAENLMAKSLDNKFFDKIETLTFGRARESSSPFPARDSMEGRLRSRSVSPVRNRSRSPSPGPGRTRRSTIVMVEKKNLAILRASSDLLFDFALSTPARKRTMKRVETIVECQRIFIDRFELESRRNSLMVDTSTGVIEVVVMEAQNLPSSNAPLLVRLAYGDKLFNTHSVECHGNDAGWVVEEKEEGKGTVVATNAATFGVDTLNIRGMIRVSVMADGFPSPLEIASLELPFFSILSTVVILDGSLYERWFPLALSSQCIPIEGETGTQSHYLQKESLLSSDFGLKPCIRLGIRWRANESADFVPRVPRTAYAIFSLPAFSLAVIDSEASHEVLEVSVQNVDIRYWESQETTETSVNVLWLQIDNQLPQSAAPVILCPTRTVAAQPVMRFLMQKNNLLSQNRLNSYETVELIVQELDIFLEQKQVVASWELVRNWVGVIEPAAGDSASSDGWGSLTLGMTPPKDIRVSPARNESLSGIRRINSSELPVIRSSVVDAALENSKIYIEHLTINSIKINVSFIMSPNVQLGGHRPEAVKTFFSGDVSNVGYACSMLLRQIGDIVLDLTSAVTDAPIVLNGLEVVHLFKKDTELAKTLQDHYLNSFLMQMYKIVGSLDLVGNPIGLVSSLGTGVRDFFFEPAHALITNPTEIRKIGRGVVKGTMSLVSNVSGGTIGTLSTFTKAAGRAVARLSGGDSAFSKRREELMRHPKSVAAAVTRPIRDIENGIYGGLIGLIKVPYNGARRSGVYGFVTGVPVGVVGVVAKPVVGLLDAVSHITESLGDAVNVLTKETHAPLRRRRLSNLFGPDGRVMAYSRTNALGTYILEVLENSRWSLSILDGRLGASTSTFLSRALLRSGMKTSAMTSAQMRELTRMLSFKASNSHNSMTRMSRRRATTDTASYREAISEARAEVLKKALRESGNKDVEIEDDFDGVPHHYLEFVVYTAILEKVPGNDIVIILSTDRVVVASYKRTPSDSHIKSVWQCLLSQSRAPMLSSNGASTVLTFRAKTEDQHLQSGGQSAKTEYELRREYNDSELVNLHNVLNALLGNFEFFAPSLPGAESNVEVRYDAELETMHVGPWAYAREIDVFEDEDVTALGSHAMKGNLELAPWSDEADIDSVDTRAVPQWLQEERQKAVDSHGRVEELTAICASGSAKSPSLASLVGGFVSYEEFSQARELGDVMTVKEAAEEWKDAWGQLESIRTPKVKFQKDLAASPSPAAETSHPEDSKASRRMVRISHRSRRSVSSDAVSSQSPLSDMEEVSCMADTSSNFVRLADTSNNEESADIKTEEPKPLTDVAHEEPLSLLSTHDTASTNPQREEASSVVDTMVELNKISQEVSSQSGHAADPSRQVALERRLERLEGLVIQLLAQHLPSVHDNNANTGPPPSLSPRRS